MILNVDSIHFTDTVSYQPVRATCRSSMARCSQFLLFVLFTPFGFPGGVEILEDSELCTTGSPPSGSGWQSGECLLQHQSQLKRHQKPQPAQSVIMVASDADKDVDDESDMEQSCRCSQRLHDPEGEIPPANVSAMLSRVMSASDVTSKSDAHTMSMANVVLLVHCRSAWDICESRRPIFEGYRPHFHSVEWLLNPWNNLPQPAWATLCLPGPGDPHNCVSEFMQKNENRERNGVLYMHFDAVVSPCTFGLLLDPFKVGLFRMDDAHFHTFGHLNKCNSVPDSGCLWYYWSPAAGENFRKAIEVSRKMYPGIPADLSGAVWHGMDDFFYVPMGALSTYKVLANNFMKADVFHEIAGPTILRLTSDITGSGLQDFGCLGGCCAGVFKNDLEKLDFKCGHKVNYLEAGIPESVTAVVNKPC